MVLFLIFSTPLLGIIVLKNRFPDFFQEEGVWVSYFKGTASFLVTAIPVYILFQLYGRHYAVFEMYLRSMIVDFLLFLVPAVGAFFLLEYRRRKEEYGRGLFVKTLAFFHGYFALTGVFAGYVYHPFYSVYRLFCYPLLMVLLICVTSFSIYLFLIRAGWTRFLSLLLPLLLSAVMTSVPVLFMLSRNIPGFFVFILILALGGVLFYFVQIRRILPGL